MTPDSMQLDPTEPGMSLREKSAWICLVTTVAIYVPYFGYVARLLSNGKFQTGTLFRAWIYAVILQTLLAILATLLFTLRQQKEPKDERDAAIEARSFRFAYGFLAVSCFLLVVIIPHFGLSPLTRVGGHETILLLSAQAVLLIFVAAEVLKYLTLAIGYRRVI